MVDQRNFVLSLKFMKIDLKEKMDPDEPVFLIPEKTTTYHEATIETSWLEVMQKELEAIEKNKTWALINLTPGHKPVNLN